MMSRQLIPPHSTVPRYVSLAPVHHPIWKCCQNWCRRCERDSYPVSYNGAENLRFTILIWVDSPWTLTDRTDALSSVVVVCRVFWARKRKTDPAKTKSVSVTQIARKSQEWTLQHNVSAIWNVHVKYNTTLIWMILSSHSSEPISAHQGHKWGRWAKSTIHQATADPHHEASW